MQSPLFQISANGFLAKKRKSHVPVEIRPLIQAYCLLLIAKTELLMRNVFAYVCKSWIIENEPWDSLWTFPAREQRVWKEVRFLKPRYFIFFPSRTFLKKWICHLLNLQDRLGGFVCWDKAHNLCLACWPLLWIQRIYLKILIYETFFDFSTILFSLTEIKKLFE